MTTPAPAAKPDNVRINRGGNQIIIPEGMPYADARMWLSRQEEAEEKIVETVDFIDCFPLDGIIALSRTLKEVFGFTELDGRPGMFGPKPPLLIQVPVPGGFETAPLGLLCPPIWEGGSLQANISGGEPRIGLFGKIKRKFEPQIKDICAKVREKLKEGSIYKGQAILMDLSYITDEREFHPISDAPQFMDLKGATNLILNQSTEFELSTSAFMILERTKECVANNISLKHGILLGGTFGTGKTLTAKLMAHKGTNNGWTFIYLKRAQDLAAGLRIAKLYAPAVLFAEDIDQVVSGGRDEELNDLLNTLDGVDTKNTPILTVLTTNHPETINPAFIRAGRIDTVIKFEPPTPETANKFVRVFAKDAEGNDLIRDGEDLTDVGPAMAGMVPAFICEAVAKAKRYCIYRVGADIVGQMTAQDLVLAANSIKDHVGMSEKEDSNGHNEKLMASLRHVGEVMNDY